MHVVAANLMCIRIFAKIGRHLGFLGPHRDSSQSPSISLHLRYVSNHLWNNFLWTSHAHRHPLRDWSRMKKIHPKMKVLEWSQHFSHYKSMGIFPDAQGQLTHKSLVRSCRISNPFQILWLSLLPARIKKNKSKMKELEWSQDCPHYNPMGAICCHGNQSSNPILPKT